MFQMLNGEDTLAGSSWILLCFKLKGDHVAAAISVQRGSGTAGWVVCCGAMEHGMGGMGCPGCAGGARAVGSSEPLQGPTVDPLGSLVADLGQPRAWAGSVGLSIKLIEIPMD